jgi:hypothetical protein
MNYCLPCHHMSYHHIIRHIHMPNQPATSAADITPATCHPSSGDTCHFRIGPTVCRKFQFCLTCVITWSHHVSCMNLPHVIVWTCHISIRSPHVIFTDMPRQRPYGLYGLHSQQFFFAYLTFQTECDIFSIQTPFNKVNIPPESGRRDRCNGVGFIGFQALSFLSIFQALTGF